MKPRSVPARDREAGKHNSESQPVPGNNKDKAIVIALVVLCALIACVPLLFVLAEAWKAGFRSNRTTVVLVVAAIALVGVVALWLRGGAVVVPPEPSPEVPKAKPLDHWSRVGWLYKRDSPYGLLGVLAAVVGVLFTIGYVKFIEPFLR